MRIIVKLVLAVICFTTFVFCGCGKRENSLSQKVNREPCVKVTIGYPNAFPEDVEHLLAFELEKALMPLPGIKTVTTSSQMGLCEAKVYFKPKVNINASSKIIRSKLRDLKQSLPADVGEFEVSVIQEKSLMFTVDIYGDVTRFDLLEKAEDLLAQASVDLSDFVTAEITGHKEIHINLDASRMRMYVRGTEDILEFLRSTKDAVTSDALPLMLFATNDYGNSIRLGDMVTVSNEYSGPIIQIDGKACVEIKFYVQSPGDVMKTAKRVRKSIDRNLAALPGNIKYKVYNTTGAKPVRLRLTLDSGGMFITVYGTQVESISHLELELKKMKEVESIRSIFTKQDTTIEFTFRANVQFQQAMKLIRDKNITIKVISETSFDGNIKMRQLPVVIERCPPQLLAIIDLFGNDASALEDTASQLSNRLQNIRGLGSISRSGTIGLREVVPYPKFDTEILTRFGIPAQEVLNALKSCYEGIVLGIDGAPSIIRVFYGSSKNRNSNDFNGCLSQSIMTKDGHEIPLSNLGKIELRRPIQEITRINGTRNGSMNVYSDGTRDTADLIEQIQTIVDDNNKAQGEIEARLFVK